MKNKVDKKKRSPGAKRDTAKKGHAAAADTVDAAALAGRKRGRSQLSAEGFEESDGEGSGNGGEGESGQEEDQESRLKREEQEKAQHVRAERKKQKLKALKVRAVCVSLLVS